MNLLLSIQLFFIFLFHKHYTISINHNDREITFKPSYTNLMFVFLEEILFLVIF